MVIRPTAGDPTARAGAREGVGLLLFLVSCSCQTAAAIEELQEVYWAATEGLVVAVLQDLWSVAWWVLGYP